MSLEIYLDGADLSLITRWAKHPAVSGFTTNPSLLKAAGVTAARFRSWAEQRVEAASDPAAADTAEREREFARL